ncbi:MAG: hypothetical protein ACREP9_00155 [Candidatus Dormibacteraceae bacterium]
MIAEDRKLLARLSAVNAAMGEIALRMMANQNGGELDPRDLRAAGWELGLLGVDMVRRADELDAQW